jgi:predicted ATP-dependent protease
MEAIQRGLIAITTTGRQVGQINALVVHDFGIYSFGRPNRVTCQVRLGHGDFVDIEREVELGGPIHSKGVLILSSFLASRFAKKTPLSLDASLVFEQSYNEVDGDSASSAELYCLLSTIADIPLNQSLAVTGSVNQLGEIQAVGAVNEKIEGFFNVCKTKGLTGEQGVIIPATTQQNLMLNPEVTTAIKNGLFHIYAVKTVDEGMEILTGLKAGKADKNGVYPPNTINGRVSACLDEYINLAQKYGTTTPRPKAE